jgi:hypothetical protein
LADYYLLGAVAQDAQARRYGISYTVDTVSIENLNSVLNKYPSLANGDRIPTSLSSKLVFEVRSLRNA